MEPDPHVVFSAQGTGRPVAAPPPPGLAWDVDPFDLAVRSSTSDHDLPTAFCVEVGRRLLQATLDFPSWVLRRVETLSLADPRSVLRKMTIELKVREDAPAFLTRADGHDGLFWLVPLTVMKRRTLVDFRLANEDGTPLTLPGLRLTQQLDESLLLAAASTLGPPGPQVREFIKDLVTGQEQTVATAMARYEAARWGSQLAELRDHKLFAMAVERLRYNFTLYVLLPEQLGRHRLLRMSFVEPVSWHYQYARLDDQDDGTITYTPRIPARWNLGHLASELGLVPTRVRFQTPAAENATSYHVEFEAPPGVRIVEATLLAGRPHVADTDFTLDPLRGDFLTVGLHGVEVPPNSLCRTQVLLRVERSGWLTTLLIATLAIFLVLSSLAFHAWWQKAPDPEQDTNVILLLVTTAAAAATFVAQRDFTGVAARLLTGMRTVGALSMSLPIIAAGVLSYHEVLRNGKPTPPEPTEPSTRVAATVLAGVALALFLLVLATWWRTRGDEKQEEVTSPWDMSLQARPDRDAGRRRHALTYTQALTAYGFDRAAVGIRSSEGWHHVYGWSDSNHEEALAALERLAGENREALGYRCGDPADCPHVGDSGCRLGYRTGTSNVARGDLDRRDTADAGSSHASVGPNGSRPSSGTGT